MNKRLAPLLAACALAPCAQAQSFPSKPVRMIVAVGGSADIFARRVQITDTANVLQPE